VIDDVWGFNATGFGMSPREAEQVDPQPRHLLEVARDARANTGIRPSLLAGSTVGVYVGVSSVDHAMCYLADSCAAGMHLMMGNSLSIMVNRISYTFDLRGPSLPVDTACSSSLVAQDLAAEAIHSGDFWSRSAETSGSTPPTWFTSEHTPEQIATVIDAVAEELPKIRSGSSFVSIIAGR